MKNFKDLQKQHTGASTPKVVLIVLGILFGFVFIGIIATVAFVLLSSPTESLTDRAHDARRVADMRAINSTIAVSRYNDGAYTSLTPTDLCSVANAISLKGIEQYLQGIPTDPVSGRNYYISVDDVDNPTQYRIIAKLNNSDNRPEYHLESDVQTDDLGGAAGAQPTGTDCDCTNQPNNYCVGSEL